MKTKLVILCLVIALLLQACSGAPAATDSSSPQVVAFADLNVLDLMVRDFISQSSYTGMTEEELREYYFAHNVTWIQHRAAEYVNGNVALYVLAPTMTQGTEMALPSLEMALPATVTALFSMGTVIAYAYTFTDAYAAKMERVQDDAIVLVPTGSLQPVAPDVSSGSAPDVLPEITWDTGMVTLGATNIYTQTGDLDVAEAATFPHSGEGGTRAAMRLMLATLVWSESTQFNQCFERPGGNGSDPAILLEFPIPNKWGSGVLFLFNVAHPDRSTFLQKDNGANPYPPGFAQMPNCSKKAHLAYDFLMQLLDALENLGKLPLWPI